VLESLLTTYGYPILVIGTFLEGETVLVLGGLAAQLGYLSLNWVIACGFCGTLIGDQLYFLLGRRHGKTLLARHPSWRVRADRVLYRLERHQNLVIVGFRFLYGLRSVASFAIGMSDISYLRFTLLNLVGAGIWAISIGVAAYYFGQAVEAVLVDIKHYELALMGGIGGFAMLIWIVHLYRRRRSARSAA
jgi:membrane protein DedA with SNARE-associated domain